MGSVPAVGGTADIDADHQGTSGIINSVKAVLL